MTGVVGIGIDTVTGKDNIVRGGLYLGVLAWSAPVLAVAGGGLGLTPGPAIAVGAGVAAVVALFAARALYPQFAGSITRPLAIALAIAAAAAIFRIATLSVFMADVNRVQFSIAPDEEFRRVHSCFSAYAESERLASAGGHNIYQRGLYMPNGVPRQIGPLRVDPFHYPPPFLLLPEAMRAIAPDFWNLRRLWFALQAVVLAGAVVGLAAWIGGAPGAFALLAGLVILALPHVSATLQQGNFQLTAIPLAAGAIALLMAGRHALGGTVLAYAALAKIFPGILVVPLIAGRQWRRLAWVAGAGVLLLALALAVVGVRPFQDFLSTALPEISSGAAFPQTEMTAFARLNWSAYGETVHLRLLGAEWLTKPRGLMIAQLYGIAVVALAAWIGWTRRFDLSMRQDRLTLLQVSLALVTLASFRSPFVGAVYGSIGTFWLMGLAGAGASSAGRQVAWLASLCALAWTIWLIPGPGNQAPPLWNGLSGLLLFVCITIGVWIALRKPIANQQTDTMTPHGDRHHIAPDRASRWTRRADRHVAR